MDSAVVRALCCDERATREEEETATQLPNKSIGGEADSARFFLAPCESASSEPHQDRSIGLCAALRDPYFLSVLGLVSRPARDPAPHSPISPIFSPWQADVQMSCISALRCDAQRRDISGPPASSGMGLVNLKDGRIFLSRLGFCWLRQRGAGKIFFSAVWLPHAAFNRGASDLHRSVVPSCSSC